LRASHGLTHKFTGFYITVERDETDAKASSSAAATATTTTKVREDNVGTFHIISHAISKFSELCPTIVAHTNSLAKSDVPVCIIPSTFLRGTNENLHEMHVKLFRLSSLPFYINYRNRLRGRLRQRAADVWYLKQL
jgi:hypothetical protein